MYYIGADLGTSALKLLLTDEAGNIVKSVTRTYTVRYPKSGWSEQDPVDWWNAFVNGVRELVCGTDAQKIRGIGVAGQMHGLVALDENDAVIRPAILWNDGRCDKETAYLNEEIGREKLSACTANIAFAGFTAPKILWLRRKEKENFDRIAKIMLPKDYINYKLTGAHTTDFSDASGTLLLDVRHKCWSAEMLSVCGISEAVMPKLFESYACIGSVLPEVAELLHIPATVQVAAGAGDNAGAAIGTATMGKGKCNISLGTSGTVFITSDTFPKDAENRLHAFCHADGGYHVMGCILSAASCNQWFCEAVLHTKDYEALQQEIRLDRLGNNEVFFLPYLMGERSPINDTDATGLFIGLRPDTSRADMLLAVLEGVCFAVRDNLEVAKQLGLHMEKSTVCGGGAKSQLWLYILANVLNLELAVPQTEEGPGYGAAKLAMVAAGASKSLADCVRFSEKAIVKPDAVLAAQYEKRYEKFKKLYPSVKQLYAEIKEENE